METRCGDIDPAVILKIMKIENYTVEEMDDLLNKKSGRVGFTGIGDFRVMKDAAIAGNEDAILMRKMQTQRMKKYIGAYMAELNHVDAVVFTGGIMENNDDEIANVISNMEELGLELDVKKNKETLRGEGLISKDTSKIKIYLIPTNEELEIAKQTVELVRENKND
jgi:acetate kinase